MSVEIYDNQQTQNGYFFGHKQSLTVIIKQLSTLECNSAVVIV